MCTIIQAVKPQVPQSQKLRSDGFFSILNFFFVVSHKRALFFSGGGRANPFIKGQITVVSMCVTYAQTQKISKVSL